MRRQHLPPPAQSVSPGVPWGPGSPPTPEGSVLTCRSELSRPLSPSLVEMSKDERLAWGVCLTEEPRDHPDTFTPISLPPSPLRSPPSSLSCFDRLCQNRQGCAAVTRSPRGSVAVRPCPGVTSPGSSRATGPSRPRGRARCRGRGDGPSRQVSEGQIWDVRPAPPPHASERTK